MRSLRFAFDYSDDQMISLFNHVDYPVTREQVCNWLKKDNDPNYVALSDREISLFLNGLIVEKRGKKDGKVPPPELIVDNNIILRKLKIALNLKTEDIQELLASVGNRTGKSEITAFFRRVEHANYRECKDQVLRNLIRAIKAKNRPDKIAPFEDSE